jgi:ferredoxin
MAKYRIRIDRETCVGDKACCEEAPGTFEMDDEGKAVVTNPEGDLPKYVLSAARNCRLEAITLHNAETGMQVWPPGHF